MASVAGITRVCTAELPYLSAFFAHHAELGVDRFHLLIQEADIAPVATAMAARAGIESVVQWVTPGSSVDGCLIAFPVDTLDADYAVLLDPDEFLMLSSGLTLDALAAQCEESGGLRMQWVMAPCDRDPAARRRGYLGHAGKHIARADRIELVYSTHTFKIIDRVPLQLDEFDSADARIVHYWGRSFTDAVLKCLYFANFDARKQSSIAEVLAVTSPATLPKRLKVLAVLNAHDRDVVIPDFLAGAIDEDLESALLYRLIDDEALARVRQAYLAFSEYIAGTDVTRLYPQNCTVQQLFDLVPVGPST